MRNITFILTFFLIFINCSKEKLPHEQRFLKPYAETEIIGEWLYDYIEVSVKNLYHKIEIFKDGIYDQTTKSYYGTGKILCVGSYTNKLEVCGDEISPAWVQTNSLDIKWRLQYIDNKAYFGWYFSEVDYNSTSNRADPIQIIKGKKVYDTQWISTSAYYPYYPATATKL